MIVIPMAGMSSRFFKAGYTQPKYMLEAHGQTCLNTRSTALPPILLALRFCLLCAMFTTQRPLCVKKRLNLALTSFTLLNCIPKLAAKQKR